ncbi:murein L,D-transpeptidase catalytic domain family protein [Vibrio sp. SS-MA-C1-2]|uniref:murein L,D-transpeptidase catalytic domain family protein n=1 Tax=Vibrio sp. SS-MA-C1-2 TaxID=2908646 RepID=UPI001F1BE8D4|nr:murein L,D-transpeptidase catalytic domain family protein [Vibrio sp. SS-MA-C1-2]UJF17381.1 murein L,D-transpeptidase catalytic domain family protein [Vibrio sp. SS-MA-C1-2]
MVFCQQVFAKEEQFRQLFNQLENRNQLSYLAFSEAMENLEIVDIKNRRWLTIIDYQQSSKDKRFYLIDLNDREVVYNTLVSHGVNSGDEYVDSFSNRLNSKKSSKGVFKTAESYYGKNGYSLRLEGLVNGVNDNARIRGVVIHGADYVSQQIIENTGRLGRSWGCPALPIAMNREIIDIIKDGSLLYIHG